VYSSVALLLALALGVAARAGAARADDELTIDPAMTKGPVTAPVTIVEFSDYQ
jgi:protein-disulfide isomerase